jgi:hypothetical protein
MSGATLLRAARTSVIFAGLSAVAGLAGACALIITDNLPAYTCESDGSLPPCPGDQVCEPVKLQCVDRCTLASCGAGSFCGPNGWCVSVNGVGLANDGATVLVGDANGEGASRSDAGRDVDSDVDSAAESGSACSQVGCRCTTNAECDSKLCGNAGIFGGAFGDDGGASFCAKPCCKSTDCDKGTVCFATGTGGNYCVPSEKLADRSTIGTMSGGQACDGGAAAGCRSGLCVSGVCADTCCSIDPGEAQCTRNTVCRFGGFPGTQNDVAFTAWCQPPNGGNGGNQNNCMTNGDCQGSLCIVGDGGFGTAGTCHDPCRNATECQRGFRSQLVCTYLQPDPVGSTALVAACAAPSAGADAGNASVCFAASDCTALGMCQPQSLSLRGTTYSVLGCK